MKKNGRSLGKRDSSTGESKRKSWHMIKLLESGGCYLEKIKEYILREEIKLLQENISQNRLEIDPVKKRVHFSVPKRSYWDCDKSSRSRKRRKVGQYIRMATEKMPEEFEAVEVSYFFAFHIIEFSAF